MKIRTTAGLCIALWIAALAAAAVIDGCRNVALAQTKLRVGKAQPQIFSCIPIDVGISAGIYQHHGLDIESVAFAGSARMQQGLAANAIDIGIGSGPELIFIAQGAPVIAVAATADAPWVVDLVVLKDGPIKTVADLKDHLVSISGPRSPTEWLIQELSRRQGWGKDGIKTVPLGGMDAQAAALKTRQVDGIVAESTTAYKLEENGSGRILVRFGELITDFHIHVIFARQELAANNPEALREFLAAWLETVAYMGAHRETTIEIAERALNVSKANAARNYDELMPMFNRTGRFNQAALDVLARSFVDMGWLRAQPDLKTYYTERFLPQ